MTATNHALTGAAIAFIVGNPYIAIPAALLSHFVCDSIPHFGSRLPDEVWLKTRAFQRLLLGDAALCVVLVLVISVQHPVHWLLACICAFLATSPDLLSINRFLKTKRNKPWSGSWLTNFARNIQWFQRPVGAVVEVAWFIAGVGILTVFLH